MTIDAVSDIAENTRTRLEAADRPAVACPVDIRPQDLRPGNDAPFARYFDHTLLAPDAIAHQYQALCEEARLLHTRTVCVPPDRVELCIAALRGTGVDVGTVIGFPLGYDGTSAKVADVEMARSLGATEFDAVVPVGRLRDGDICRVYDAVRAVVAAADGRVVKVIMETALLTNEEKIVGAAAALHAGAVFLMTSTGYSTAGATIDDLKLFRTIAGETRGVKAAGGIRDLVFARACIAAGADRIGTSATVAILGAAAEGREYL